MRSRPRHLLGARDINNVGVDAAAYRSRVDRADFDPLWPRTRDAAARSATWRGQPGVEEFCRHEWRVRLANLADSDAVRSLKRHSLQPLAKPFDNTAGGRCIARSRRLVARCRRVNVRRRYALRAGYRRDEHGSDRCGPTNAMSHSAQYPEARAAFGWARSLGSIDRVPRARARA
jgi:hypothetical protein